uniref:Uncharacterized protein n=1 Tax=Bionectria ochroleuca TaxID=29856 RepID=A0A8H7NDI9_BIOOC
MTQQKASDGGKVSNLIDDLKEKFSDTKLHDAKIALVHKKHQIGKLGNLFNPNHRHDEEHEQRCDDKRTKICESNRFKSFFPERDGNLIKWYVDGRDYFWAVSVALEQAKESIYIADWWLSPELFLRRPHSITGTTGWISSSREKPRKESRSL